MNKIWDNVIGAVGAFIIKMMSRKIIASLLVFVTATYLLWENKMNGNDWVTVSVWTMIGLIAGQGMGFAIGYFKNLGVPIPKTFPPINTQTLRSRVENMFSAPFIAAMVVYIVGTFLLWHGKINVTEWTYVALGLAVGYDVLNPLEKFRTYEVY